MALETRNQVMAAVLARLQGMQFPVAVTGQTAWVTCEQKLKLWGDVPPAEQPACYLVTHSEQDDYSGNGIARRRLHLAAWCYTRSDSSIGADDLDSIMESFDQTFGPNAADNTSRGQLTLGGLVYWCRIQGKVFKDPGDLDGQTLLIVPIVIEMP